MPVFLLRVHLLAHRGGSFSFSVSSSLVSKVIGATATQRVLVPSHLCLDFIFFILFTFSGQVEWYYTLVYLHFPRE